MSSTKDVSRKDVAIESTLKVSLAVGTLQWGTTPIDNTLINSKGVISESEASLIVNEFQKAGITLWDTAEGYGGGTSEKRLGRNKYPEMKIMTKFLPVPWRYSHKCFENAVRSSMKRLNVTYIDVYLLHSPIHWRPIEFWVEAASQCKKQGLIGSLGLSNCSGELVERAISAGKKFGIEITSNQVHYSLLAYNSKSVKDMEEACRKHNVKIIGFSPIGQGLLTDNGVTSEEHFHSNRISKMLRLSYDDIQPLRIQLKILSDKYEKSMAQIAINWSICHGVIPLVGCRSLHQAKDSIGAVGWKLREDDVQTLDELALNRSTLDSPSWRRGIFVTLAGIVMLLCRIQDFFGFGKEWTAAVLEANGKQRDQQNTESTSRKETAQTVPQ